MLTIGEAVRKARTDRNITRSKLAQESGINRYTIMAWEQDRTSPTLLNLWAVADVLGMSIDELVGRTITND